MSLQILAYNPFFFFFLFLWGEGKNGYFLPGMQVQLLSACTMSFVHQTTAIPFLGFHRRVQAINKTSQLQHCKVNPSAELP